MPSLFFRQFAALFRKNWIIIFNHKFLNLFRSVLLPVGYATFLALAQIFLSEPNNYGIGSPAPIYNFTNQFDGSLSLVWADATNGAGNPSASNIMAHITSGFNAHQLGAVKQVSTPQDIPSNCPQNFNLITSCYAGITFNYLPTSPIDTNPINYTITVDAGLGYVNVYSHTSDFETRVLPLQFAIDEAFITLGTGQSMPTPLQWPYTQETNDQQFRDIRLSFIRGIRTLLVVALFVAFVGISYQLPGAIAAERASLLTSHMKAMGLLDSARILSWLLSISLANLPAWICIALIWHYQIFTETNAGLILVVHLLLGFSLASWSCFLAAPFGNSPQLAAVASSFSAFLSAILALVVSSRASTAVATIFTLIFPPGFYIFAIRTICGYENHLRPTNLLKSDPDSNLTLLPIMIASIVSIFLWPYLAVLLERYLYDAKEPSSGFWFWRRKQEQLPPHPNGVAISIKNLRKTFSHSMFSLEKGPVTAVADLSLDIPKSGIFVLLGSNGAGKSTSLSIIANLIGRSSGSITFEGGVKRPPRGMLGIVPQKNVLFPELTCYQTLRVWNAIKYSSYSASEDEDYEQLLRDCDLGKKIHSNANTLSGGQKRKLQLAIGLIGGSKIVLVDECTSGVDPLSRRALWKTLMMVKHDRTIVFTTHFLDEADLLADRIAVLAAPGKLVAQGSPVALKTSLGQGYSVQVTFESEDMYEKDPASSSMKILGHVRELAPQCTLTHSSATLVSYHLKSKDTTVVERVLQMLEDKTREYRIASVDVLGTSIEDIFLQLMETHSTARKPDMQEKPRRSIETIASDVSTPTPQRIISAPIPLLLSDGRARSPFSQALTILYKRILIARRSWLSPVLTVAVAVCGACVPLFFLSGQAPSCATTFGDETILPLYWPVAPIDAFGYPSDASILESPPNITGILGQSASSMSTQSISDNATFVSTIQQNYLNTPVGGISIDVQTNNALIAWDATPPPGLAGPAMLNLATNILYNLALNTSGESSGTPSNIMANFANFPPITGGALVDSALKWVIFFGAAMVVYPAFFSLYVSRERRSSVQAMQVSNGLSNPIGLWLGHLLWDSMFGVIIATIIVVIFSTMSNQFYGLGFLWVVLVQYGIVSALFAYCFSIFMSSPLSTFAAVATYQFVMYTLYLAAYLLILTYAKNANSNQIMTTIHFTMSLLSPINSVMRSAFISVNLFSLVCNGSAPVTTSSLGDIMRYGGPIVYLFVYGFVLFGLLIWADSGSIIPRFLKTRKRHSPLDEKFAPDRVDVATEARAVANSDDSLRILRATKSFDGKKVVDDVSFGVPGNVIFAMLGPNGAGKTTTFNMIRGDITPDIGDIKIKGVSVVNSPRNARLALGVCPQFTAIDSELTVREHLMIYGRLKGLTRGSELKANVESLMVATSLSTYADRSPSRLSGGNQRKLSLAIALLGNPSVVLIDEFSSGVDAKMKRDMWGTLRNVAGGKAVVLTTHSLEEASALASKVGFISKKMLAIGSIEEVTARYASYQVQFSCSTREEVLRAQVLMSRIPGVRLADDVGARFEVPIRSGAGGGGNGAEEGGGGGEMSLASLFRFLSSQGDFMEYTVERATLESVFLKVVRQSEEEAAARGPVCKHCGK